MQFLSPIWLTGLAGILIPLAIHLLSRKEGKVIRIGSLRHLDETSTKQFKSVRLNEIVLLTLRSLLIVWMILLFAGLTWNTRNTKTKKWVLIEKGLEHNDHFATLVDSLKTQSFEVREFAPGFSVVADSVTHKPGNYWDLIESLKEAKVTDAVIVAANRVEQLHGKKITLPTHYRWISEDLPAHQNIISAVPFGKDSLWIRRGTFTTEQTSFESEKKARTLTDQQDSTITITVAASKTMQYDGAIVLAALQSIDKFVPEQFVLAMTDDKNSDYNTDWIIWLSEAKIPETSSRKIIWTGLPDPLLLQTSMNTWTISGRIDRDRALSENLALRLASVIIPNTKAWKTANDHDVRSFNTSLLMGDDDITPDPGASLAATSWLWALFIVVTLVAERFVSYRKKQ